MADQNPRDCAEGAIPNYSKRNAEVERIVLAFVIDEHPTQLTILEVSQALNTHPRDFESNDAVERAIRELVGGGLLQCHGPFVIPTRAALYCSNLEMD